MDGNKNKKEFGDYQTPDFFAETVCNLLRDKLRITPEVVIEPTSGLGNFLHASFNSFQSIKQAYGIEINPEYCEACRKRILDARLKIINDNFFSYQIEQHIGEEETLFVGNPPWATNSELNFNLPEKENFKRLSGTDAITGASNFDICEYIILKLIEKSIDKKVAIAMLCKTSVARNVLLELDRNDTCVDFVKMYNFNSAKVFGISASACLLFIKMSTANVKCRDCAGVMELEKKVIIVIGIRMNKEEIELEETLVFPLIKSSSFKTPIICSEFKKFVIVTQKKAREETDYIRQLAPKTWEHLCGRKALFDSRKSSIYKGAPAFSMFGVGDYSYAEYKVGISGFYKKPLFSLLYNEDRIEQPIMVDDTSYFLSFDNYSDAYTCMLLLNSSRVQEFLLSISFQDAKRPYTKKVLQRLDFTKCIELITFEELVNAEKELNLPKTITEDMYTKFGNYIIGLKNAG